MWSDDGLKTDYERRRKGETKIIACEEMREM